MIKKSKPKVAKPVRQFERRPTITEGDLYSLFTAREKIKRTTHDVAVMVMGPTGVGKSTMVMELGEELGCNVLDVRAQQIESIDLRGMPTIIEIEQWLEQQKSMGVDISTIDTSRLPQKIAAWMPFSNLLPIPAIHGDKGILFLDEFNLASIDVKKACYELILNRRVGGYVLPEGWRIVAAGNRRQDVGAEGFVGEMGHALNNRFRHVFVDKVKTEEQKAGLFKWFYEHNVHPIIISYLKFYPDAIHAEPKDTDEETERFPTQRSWEMFSKQIMNPDSGLLDDNGNLTSDKMLIMSDCADFVGKGWAMHFVKYIDVYHDIPDPKMILEKGIDEALKISGKEIPKKTDTGKVHALVTSVVSHLKNMHKEDNVVENFFDFTKRIEREIEMYAAQEAWQLKDVKESLKQSTGFKDFCKRNAFLVL
jgi:DNA polymerase III delta prime subunit